MTDTVDTSAFDAFVAEAIALKAKGKGGTRGKGAKRQPATTRPAHDPEQFRYTPRYTERATALCTIVMLQHCRCCGGTTESIGGQFVEFTSTTMQSRRQVSVMAEALTLTKDEISALPLKTDYSEREVHFCPACLHAGEVIENLLGITLDENRQADLFRRAG